MSIINAVIFGGTPKVEGVFVTVHGAVYEDITLSDGQVITTDANGEGSAVVSVGTITLTGSVSGKSFTEIVTDDTTDLYCMPKKSLYWYGNFNGNTYYTNWSYSPSNKMTPVEPIFNQNSIICNPGSSELYISGISFDLLISSDVASKVYATCKGSWMVLSRSKNFGYYITESTDRITSQVDELHTLEIETNIINSYYSYCTYNGYDGAYASTLHAMWLE